MIQSFWSGSFLFQSPGSFSFSGASASTKLFHLFAFCSKSLSRFLKFSICTRFLIAPQLVLVMNSTGVITDSGGLQKEAFRPNRRENEVGDIYELTQGRDQISSSEGGRHCGPKSTLGCNATILLDQHLSMVRGRRATDGGGKPGKVTCQWASENKGVSCPSEEHELNSFVKAKKDKL